MLLQIDTLATVIQQVRYVGEVIPPSAQTATWVFVCLGGLLFLLVIAIVCSSSSLVYTLRDLFEVTEKNSIFNDTTTNNSYVRFLLVLFFTGVFSFFCYVYLQPESFSLISYLIFWGVTGLFFLVKLLLFNLLGFVFLNPGLLKTARETYFNTLSFLGVILYPVLVIRIYSSPVLDYKIIDTIGMFLFLLAFLFIVFKLIQLFFGKLVDFFYILLYLCTLEILPFIALFRIYEMIV